MDRRSFLSATPAVVAVALASATAVSAMDIAPPQSAEPTKRDDAKFWVAHREWQDIRNTWNADTDPDEDAVWERYGARDTEALERMMMIPVSTAMAVMAKYQATQGADINLPFPAVSSLQMIEWDLGRVCMKEMR